MRSLFTLAFAGFSLLGTVPVAPTVVQGRFSGKGVGGQPLPFGLMSVKLKAGKTTLAASYVQPDGRFSLANASGAPTDLYYSALGVEGDVYVAAIPAARPDTLRLALGLPASYPKRHGRAICPKCQRADKVLDIVYGDGSAIVVRTSTAKGDTVYRPYDKKHYYAGTCLLNDLDPAWWCRRDSLRF